MTFFAWVLPPTVRADARQGTEQITATPFWIPEASVDFWVGRLAAADVDFDGPETRFDEPVISFLDPDGRPLELVARAGGALRAPWEKGAVPPEHAVRGFSGAR